MERSNLLQQDDAKRNTLRAERAGPPRMLFFSIPQHGLGHRFAEFLEAARRIALEGRAGSLVGEANAGPRLKTLRDHIPSRDRIFGLRATKPIASPPAGCRSPSCRLDSAWQGLMVPAKYKELRVARPVLFVEVAMRDCRLDCGIRWRMDRRSKTYRGLLEAIAQAMDPENASAAARRPSTSPKRISI